MKKIFILFCATCISFGALAQNTMRFGNTEIIVRQREQGTTDCPPENGTNSGTDGAFKKYNRTNGFWGIGFIIPGSDSRSYATLGGNSFNLDFGGMRRYQLTREFALVGTLQYSFYNYRMRDAALKPEFVEEVIGREYDRYGINKQVFRSHNIAAGAFARYYLVPPRSRGNDGLYVDIGAQGDFLYSKFFKIKTQSQGNDKYREDFAFNPFTASAVARIGWNGGGSNLGIGKYYKQINFIGINPRAIFIRYRFTDVFNQKALPMDLPRFTVGIQFF